MISNNNLEEITLVVPDIDYFLFQKIQEDLIDLKIDYEVVGLIERCGIFAINGKFMATKSEIIKYIDSLNKMLERWKDYDPYIDEGGIN